MRSPRDLIVPVAVLVGVVALVAAVVARDDSSSSGAGSGASTTTSVSGSDESAADSSSSVSSSDSITGRSTTTAAVPTVPPASVAPPAATLAVPTTVATAATAATPTTPPGSDPFASTPPTELPPEPDELPGPPVDDCIDAAAGLPTVELTFDLDHVRYGSVVDPSCVRIHAAQRLAVRSESAVATSVSVGAEVWELANGASATTDPLGVRFQIGDVFDVYVDSLDLTVLVQVLA
jgi:hypothetical protein